MKKTILFWFCLLTIFRTDPAFPDFQTPDTGTTYTLAYLAAFSAGAIEPSPSGFVIKEKVTISGKDALQAENETLLINIPDDTHNPTLVVQGRLKAFNMKIRTNPDSIVHNTLGNEIQVTGLGHNGMAEAILTSCTLQNLMTGLSARAGGKVMMDQCLFKDCRHGGLHIYSQGQAFVTNSLFQNSSVVVNSSHIVMQNTHIQGEGLYLDTLIEDSSITDCTFSSSKDVGIYVHGGKYGEIRDNEIHHCNHGIIVTRDASLTLENNLIRDNLEGGLVVTGQAIPRIRGNTFQRNALDPPLNKGGLILPGIYIDEKAQPDLGTRSDHGNNVFLDSGQIYLYYAGKKTIYAFGNNWGKPDDAGIEYVIYHRPDDLEDADGSEFLSGWVILNDVINIPQSRGIAWY